MFFTSDEEANAFYRSSRADNMDAARACKAALTNPKGFWRYPPDDARVKAAAGEWVRRARRAHRILMGRQPIISKFAVMRDGNGVTGDLYATTRKEA